MLSNARKTRGIPRTPIGRGVHGAGGSGGSVAAGIPDGTATPDGFGPDMFAPARVGGKPSLTEPIPRNAPGRGLRKLKNLRVRSRLLLLVVIPTVTAVAAGGVFIASSYRPRS
jgi:hypothetical protein